MKKVGFLNIVILLNNINFAAIVVYFLFLLIEIITMTQ